MGARTRSGKGIQEHLQEPVGDGRSGIKDALGSLSDSTGGEGSDGVGGSGSVTRKTHSVTTLEDGTICIGADCAVIRVPLIGDIQIDTRECPDDVADRISQRLNEGAGADFKLKAKARK